MFRFFTDPYEDEILYSVIARYHYYYGNVNYKDTIREVFGSDNVIPSVELPSHLEALSSQFPGKTQYNSNFFIENHTILPFYIPFLDIERRYLIENEMRFGNGKGLYSQIGFTAGSICKKSALEYCPLCSIEDTENYGEAYFRRVHQLQGVFVCPKHKCLLKQYPITRKDGSRILFIRLDYDDISVIPEYEEDKHIGRQMLAVAKAALYLLKNNLKHFNWDLVFEKYQVLLRNKNFTSIEGNIRQKELWIEFRNHYGDEFLDRLESRVDENNQFGWLGQIVRKTKQHFHPIRHILLILFLNGSMEEFFEKNIRVNKPFGYGPWPCLNPAAQHYKEFVVSGCDVTADYKTREPVGTFKCSCGFVYSRRGPDNTSEDKFKIGRIKQFGEVWEHKAKSLILEKKYGIRELGRLMGCDPKTIIKCAEKHSLRELLNTTIKLDEPDNFIDVKNKGINLEELYKREVLVTISLHPEYTRKQLRNCLKKQYAWLYRNEREWLNKNFPPSIPAGKRNLNTQKRVNWQKRDSEILQAVNAVYKELMGLPKPVRITKSLIGKRIGKATLLEMHIDKMPRTKAYLEKIIESIEEFQLRRVDLVCKKLLEENKELKKWEIVKKAGLRPQYSKKVEDRIERNINIYRKREDLIG